MKADEIRAKADSICAGIYNEDRDAGPLTRANKADFVQLLSEIAAQLAEMNEARVSLAVAREQDAHERALRATEKMTEDWWKEPVLPSAGHTVTPEPVEKPSGLPAGGRWVMSMQTLRVWVGSLLSQRAKKCAEGTTGFVGEEHYQQGYVDALRDVDRGISSLNGGYSCHCKVGEAPAAVSGAVKEPKA